MRYKIEGGSLPVVTIELNRGESIFTQSGGMSWMSGGIDMDTNMKGGFLGGLGRMFTGESLFLATYTSRGEGQQIALASSFPGSIIGHAVEKTLAPGEQLKVNTGNVAAFESSVRYNIETVKGFKNVLFGGEGLFLTVLTGPGRVWLQTISMPEFAQKIIPFLPTPSSGN